MATLSKGLFVVFEGLDGAGKSTQAKNLFNYLTGEGLDVVLTREPSDSVWGKTIRAYASDHSIIKTPEEELDLFLKDREWHVENIVNPALEKKSIVITDRYYFSTIAYQGAKGIDVGRIRKLCNKFPVPDLVFYLKVAPEEGVSRITIGRKDKLTQFEKEDYLQKVQSIFDTFEESYFFPIDARLAVDLIFKEVAWQVGVKLKSFLI